MATGQRTTRGARAVRAGAYGLLVLASGLPLTACGSDTRDTQVDACLAQAVEAASTWPVTGTPILDTVDRCKDLSTADKTRLRAVLAAFVARISDGASLPAEQAAIDAYPCLEEVGDIGCTG